MIKNLSKIVIISVVFTCIFPSITQAAQPNATRGEFMQMVVQQLNLTTKAEQFINKNDYPRVPSRLLPVVDALAGKNALMTFGSTIAPARTITKGEAVRIVVAVKNVQSNKVESFRDVKRNTVDQKAVSAAIERGWVTPESVRYFGFNEPLTTPEAQLLLGKVTGRFLQEDTSVDGPSVIPITNNTTTIQVPISRQSGTSLPNQPLVETVWQLIQDDYLRTEGIDEQEAAWEVAEALTNTLDDKYSSFMRPQSTSEFFTNISGEIFGIGAQVQETNSLVEVVAPLPGTPAERAGLRPGDKILKVNEEDITKLSFTEAVNKIRGPRGSIARLTVLRDYSELTIFVERDLVRVPDYKITWQGNVAIVRIMQFGQATSTTLRKELIAINERNPQGIILDLRNNPGGLLDGAGRVVAAFVPKGSTYAHIVTKNSSTPSFTFYEPVINTATPLVVLINGGSASASEITAGALQDLDRASVVGETSFGKGTVQQIHSFTDGSSLKLTVAEWLTPNKRKIDQVGIDPDYTVEASQDRDAELLKALQLLQ